MKMLDLLEPEEAVGTLWHGMVTRRGIEASQADSAVTLEEVRASVATLYRALGGGQGVEICPAPATPAAHRITGTRRIAAPRLREHVADFDGDRLALPPVMTVFPETHLNRAAYLWLAALAAFVEIPPRHADPLAADRAEIGANALAADRAYAACPGLRRAYADMCTALRVARFRPGLPKCEAGIEAVIAGQLAGADELDECLDCPAPRGYRPFAPVAIWLRLTHPAPGKPANDDASPGAPAPEIKGRKAGARENRDQADRRDSFIVHRFEAILSWAESLNLNRMVEDDDDENAQKAADDQDQITLSQNAKRAATRLRLSLDLSPQDADHERLAGKFTYPEWNRRTTAYMPAHTRVLEAPALPAEGYRPDPRLVARVKRQFAPLNPRRVILPRQLDGDDLDLDAVVASRADIVAGREGSDRIWQSSRPMARDLSVAILMDCSRSTEAHLGDRSVIDVAREALAALAAGIDTAGDRLGIWGFSSLRRDRVFLSKAKAFDEPMTTEVTARIGGFRPGHYTRLGAAIRHASAQLAEEGATRRLLLVLTDGKPNDLDHYEGQHGIEDSRMAVREARALGQSVHGVIIDADGQDWFQRIFGRAGFTLLPHADRLPRALPDIYQTLTQET
ncbi:nitric oxide reductase activation protein NorD [Maritimibacter sp. DP1N21-5]|uniref:nitric oxide reductase activation protein NorD n=1 Tax=Maritimibacter sp. DP1N21-5 TaxID=2836867 RepID=UPI001C4656DE|nr:VWA domain-containing protein [Maritimibacter sp. DP1N21-5]MBV7410067.1 VWA domain-containing protein [Maritimibacter sp. DP1N21-5]